MVSPAAVVPVKIIVFLQRLFSRWPFSLIIACCEVGLHRATGQICGIRRNFAADAGAAAGQKPAALSDHCSTECCESAPGPCSAADTQSLDEMAAALGYADATSLSRPIGVVRPRKPAGSQLRLDLHVLEITRLVVDADLGRRDPGCEFAHARDRRHQRGDKVAVFG